MSRYYLVVAYIHTLYNDKLITYLLKGQGGTVHNVSVLFSYMPKLLEWNKENQNWLDKECMDLLGMTIFAHCRD